jgi:hypothetical protein
MARGMQEEGTASIYVMGQLAGRERILADLEGRCPDAAFIDGGGGFSIDAIKECRSELDGVLVLGSHLDAELGSIGLPVIVVKDLWSWERGMESFYRGQRVSTACVSQTDLSKRVYEARLEDLASKIGLIIALAKVKRSKLLDLTHLEAIQPDDQRAGREEDYDDTYLDLVRELFGLEVVRIGFDSLNMNVDLERAEEIADAWIDEAQSMRDTNRENVVKSAAMYLGVRKLMEEHGANAVSMSGWTGFKDGRTMAFPCLGFTELSKDLIPNNCESLIDAILTEMLGIQITGRPGFVGDTVIDPLNGVAIWGHCKCPVNPHGDDRVPYIIRDHTGWPQGTGAGVQVLLPLGETVTAVKISVYDRRISILTGETVSGESLYKDFQDLSCRTKLVAKLDTRAFLSNYDASTFGIHRVIFYGDWRQNFLDLAKLIGFDVVEEDR